jgi:uncharacterized protein YegP (UPF0339 family)
MADVRFLIIVGPPSLDPVRMGFPPRESGEPFESAPVTTLADPHPMRRRPGDHAAPDGWYAWRLMASNNRRLARSVSSFASRLVAVDAITLLRSQLDSVQPNVLTDPRNGSWGWRAELDGVAVAACPHWYERERDSRAGFRRFVDAARLAGVAEGGTVLRDGRAPLLSGVTVERQRRWPAN